MQCHLAWWEMTFQSFVTFALSRHSHEAGLWCGIECIDCVGLLHLYAVSSQCRWLWKAALSVTLSGAILSCFQDWKPWAYCAVELIIHAKCLQECCVISSLPVCLRWTYFILFRTSVTFDVLFVKKPCYFILCLLVQSFYWSVSLSVMFVHGGHTNG